MFQDRGETVFAACAADSDTFGGAGRTWKINFRVDDRDATVDELRRAGIAVEPHAESYPNGRFAELEDPEGNRIQLWGAERRVGRARPGAELSPGWIVP